MGGSTSNPPEIGMHKNIYSYIWVSCVVSDGPIQKLILSSVFLPIVNSIILLKNSDFSVKTWHIDAQFKLIYSSANNIALAK